MASPYRHDYAANNEKALKRLVTVYMEPGLDAIHGGHVVVVVGYGVTQRGVCNWIVRTTPPSTAPAPFNSE
ncbi:hypothetical protein E2562_037546 [Oryza meyeriana var. granulata]|uniref:Uncharacterized protein n=1 Tax=Oryza meyeriana var. granulata TaxID=110450 RepID=A0A6G1DVE0_9ORYZ|nr:hypothetical protein E2562_037546 [Oryza meyeriana var. granulata]